MPVHTFNIATDAAGTFSSYVFFAADKFDAAGTVADSDLDEFAGATWANDIDTAFVQINEVFQGGQSIDQLLIGHNGGTTPYANANQLVVGDTASNNNGLSIMTSEWGRIAFGTPSGVVQGAVVYRESTDQFFFQVGGSLVLEMRNRGSYQWVRPVLDNTYTLGSTSYRWSTAYAHEINLGPSGTQLTITRGNGSPEGSESAFVGSLYLRNNGGAGTTLYVKESGTGTTGWVGK